MPRTNAKSTYPQRTKPKAHPEFGAAVVHYSSDPKSEYYPGSWKFRPFPIFPLSIPPLPPLPIFPPIPPLPIFPPIPPLPKGRNGRNGQKGRNGRKNRKWAEFPGSWICMQKVSRTQKKECSISCYKTATKNIEGCKGGYNCKTTVPESLGMPVTGSPSTLKGYHNHNRAN